MSKASSSLLQNLADMTLVVLVYFLGRILSRMLVEPTVRCLRWLYPSVPRKRQYAPAHHAHDGTSPDFSEASAVASPPETSDMLRQRMLELLDQYDVFHVPAGAWIGAVSQQAGDSVLKSTHHGDARIIDEVIGEDVGIVDCASCDQTRKAPGNYNGGLELLEYYGVFGASVGSWTRSAAGSIITAVA